VGVRRPLCCFSSRSFIALSVNRSASCAACRRSTLVQPLPSTQVHYYSSTEVAEAARAAAADDDDDCMQAYEDMLLNAASPSEEGESVLSEHLPTDVTTAPTYTTPAFSPPVTNPAETLVEEALAVLPVDGTAVQLTDITPLLDLETISDHFGSARGFFQLYPHRFTCVQDEKSKRWRVARAAAMRGSGAPALAPTKPSPPAMERMTADPTSHAELDLSEIALREELALLQPHAALTSVSSTTPAVAATTAATPHKQTRRSALVSVAADLHLPWDVIAALLPDDGSPISIAQLRSLLPSDVAEALRTHHMGLARCYKLNYEEAHHFLALSADSTFLLRRNPNVSASATAPTAVPLSLWTPPVGPSANTTITQHMCDSAAPTTSARTTEMDDGVYVPVPVDAIDFYVKDAADAWWVTVPLEDEMGSAEEQSSSPYDTSAQPHSVNEGEESDTGSLDTATGLEEVPYEGITTARTGHHPPHGSGGGDAVGDASLLAGLDLALLYHAPPVPKPAAQLPNSLRPSAGAAGTTTAADGSAGKQQKKRTRVPRPTTAAEWIALHTTLANAHGWLTPPEMLDYLVECIPTFFVPLEEVRTSDALLKLVGPRTSMRTLLTRIYMYYVERSEDGTKVRLAESVTHPQRGAANPHYAAWDPATTWRGTKTTNGWRSDNNELAGAGTDFSTDLAEPLSPLPSSCGFSKLQASDATKAFPMLHVLRPIKSALSNKRPRRTTPGNASSSTTTAAAAFPAMMSHAGAAMTAAAAAVPTAEAGTTQKSSSDLAGSGASGRKGVTLAFLSPTDIGYPYQALATQPATSWPWWAKLLCVLPFDTYVPLADLGIHYVPGLSPAEVELAWRASESIAEVHAGKGVGSPHPFPYTLLRPPSDGARQVRLRPFWLAPGSTAELDTTVLPTDLVKHIRPVWMAVPRVLQKLSSDTREAVMSLALRRMPGTTCTADEAFVCLLRDCGRCCWVNEEGTKVRRYAASQEMDDIFHASLSLLYGFSSARAWEPLGAVLAKAAEHVQPLFNDRSAGVAHHTPYNVGLLGMLHRTPGAEQHTFLKRHAQWVDVKVESSAGEGDGLSGLLVRRRVAYAAFAPET
jgi:hypothetical protein